MKVNSFEKLLIHELKDLYSAENQIEAALPKMIKAASDPDLNSALTKHLKETKNQIKRLEKIFQGLDYQPGGEKCKGAEGLIKEGESALKDLEGDYITDAGIIAASQRIKHYEMAGYGCAIAYAKQLGMHDAVRLLTETLEEEAAADEKLSRLAERKINLNAEAAA